MVVGSLVLMVQVKIHFLARKRMLNYFDAVVEMHDSSSCHKKPYSGRVISALNCEFATIIYEL